MSRAITVDLPSENPLGDPSSDMRPRGQPGRQPRSDQAARIGPRSVPSHVGGRRYGDIVPLPNVNPFSAAVDGNRHRIIEFEQDEEDEGEYEDEEEEEYTSPSFPRPIIARNDRPHLRARNLDRPQANIPEWPANARSRVRPVSPPRSPTLGHDHHSSPSPSDSETELPPGSPESERCSDSFEDMERAFGELQPDKLVRDDSDEHPDRLGKHDDDDNSANPSSPPSHPAPRRSLSLAMNTKTLNFYPRGLQGDVTVIFTFEPPTSQSHRLFKDQFPVVWKVVTFRAEGPGRGGNVTIRYPSLFAFGYVRIDQNNLVDSTPWVEVRSGDISSITGGPSQRHFEENTKDNGTKLLTCKNNTDGPANLSIGFIRGSDTHQRYEPTFVWTGVRTGSSITAEFSPVLSAYFADDPYKATQMLRGETGTDAIWTQNLDDLDDSTGWYVTEDDRSGTFNIQNASNY